MTHKKMVYLTRSNLMKATNENLIFMESIMLFDIWLTMKIRWLAEQGFQVVLPFAKIALIMSIGILVTVLMDEECSAIQKTDGDSLDMQNSHIYKYCKGQILPDFASEASGALIIGTPDTKTYNEPKLQLAILGLPIWKSGYYTPRKVIQPWTEAGECWAFDGSRGKIIIEMAYAIVIERVTLEHIPVSAALTGNIDSAPKSFKVWGKVADTFTAIGAFTYDDKGLFSQTFEIRKTDVKDVPLKIVMIEILSNYGHPRYTCVYRFRIHGKIHSLNKEESFV